MPIYKRCGRCGKRLLEGTRCQCQKKRHQEYDKYSRNRKSKQYYNSKEWEISRAEALEADGGIDVYIFMTTGQVIPADTVHHIVPLKDDWNRGNDIENLMSLFHDTHSLIEKKYKKDKNRMQAELKEMLKQYRNMIRGGAV